MIVLVHHTKNNISDRLLVQVFDRNCAKQFTAPNYEVFRMCFLNLMRDNVLTMFTLCKYSLNKTNSSDKTFVAELFLVLERCQLLKLLKLNLINVFFC